jgi:formate dehydrogenase iron-sulfur subunit
MPTAARRSRALPVVSQPPVRAQSAVPPLVAPANGEAMGFFTDTTICIGCKACEVACKEWNQLPARGDGGAGLEMSGVSYDNTLRLSGTTWRHVKFIEQFDAPYDGRWLMMSDVCKHCVQAPCLEVCPTGAIVRTEFDTVVIQSDVCNGCRDCIAACPFGVIDINPASGTAQKCTLCNDRLSVGLEPACSKACPTDSIQFGPISELRGRAEARVAQLRASGESRARLYGADPNGPLGGLNAFYLLVDEPEVYGLPADPKLPTRNLVRSSLWSTVGSIVMTVIGAITLRKRRMGDVASAEAGRSAMSAKPND